MRDPASGDAGGVTTSIWKASRWSSGPTQGVSARELKSLLPEEFELHAAVLPLRPQAEGKNRT